MNINYNIVVNILARSATADLPSFLPQFPSIALETAESVPNQSCITVQKITFVETEWETIRKKRIERRNKVEHRR